MNGRPLPRAEPASRRRPIAAALSRQGAATVLVADNAVQQALAESALREAGVAFVTRNEAIQHMLGAGQIGGINLVTGPPAIQVAAGDAERAAEILREALGAAEPGYVAADAEDAFSPREKRAIRHARMSAVWAVLHLWGAGSLLAVYFGARSLASRSAASFRAKALAAFGVIAGSLGLLSALAAWLG